MRVNSGFAIFRKNFLFFPAFLEFDEKNILFFVPFGEFILFLSPATIIRA